MSHYNRKVLRSIARDPYKAPEVRRAARRALQGLGDVPPAGVVCPPGYTYSSGACQPPQPSWFQRIGAALTGFFNAPATTGLPPGYVPPQPSFTQSPLFLPLLIGGGIVAVMLLKKED
jgi:hypothetical protein